MTACVPALSVCSIACRDKFHICNGLHLQSPGQSRLRLHLSATMVVWPVIAVQMQYLSLGTFSSWLPITLQHCLTPLAVDMITSAGPPVMSLCHSSEAISLNVNKRIICYCTLHNHMLVSVIHQSSNIHQASRRLACQVVVMLVGTFSVRLEDLSRLPAVLNCSRARSTSTGCSSLHPVYKKCPPCQSRE